MEENKAMTPGEKQSWFARYNASVHRQGRLWLVWNLALLLALPFLMGLVLDTMPDMGVFWKGFFNVAIIYYPTSLVEYLIYVPMLGSGASYLSFITGNLSNLKIPCAINARDIADTRAGTPENEVISTLSVATSSLVTVLILALGVLLLVWVCMIQESFDKLLQLGEYTPVQRRTEKKAEIVGGIYWPVVTAVFLAAGFSRLGWSRSALIWPIAGVLFAAIRAVIRLREQK